MPKVRGKEAERPLFLFLLKNKTKQKNLTKSDNKNPGVVG